MFKQPVKLLFKQLNRLWTWLNYSAHDFRCDGAHYRACSFSIVKPVVKVITIQLSADALSMEEVVKLFSIDAHFARLSYSQDKRKVERCVRNLTGSSSITFRKFSEWLKGKPGQYKEWFNYSRFYGGVKTFPAELYECNVRNLTRQNLKTYIISQSIITVRERVKVSVFQSLRNHKNFML